MISPAFVSLAIALLPAPTARGDSLPAALAAEVAILDTTRFDKPEAVARAEQATLSLDALGGKAVRARAKMHASLAMHYAAAGDDTAMQRHVDAVRGVIGNQEVVKDTALVPHIVIMMDRVSGRIANRGDYTGAIALLHQAQHDGLGSTPWLRGILEKDLGRYEQIGKAATPLEASDWLNAPTNRDELSMKGVVTIVEFTAHWCVPCAHTYPGLRALDSLYSSRGLRIVLATQKYGFFEGRKNQLTSAAEVEADKHYFIEKSKIHFPVAIADSTKSSNDNLNFERYFVQGIPQLVIIDRKGIIRSVGFTNDPMEASYRARIEKLLGEPASH